MHYYTERKTSRAIGEYITKAIHEICCVREGSEGTIFEATKGYIWATAQCTSVLTQISNRLENNGFIINIYDPCMANKLVNG